MVGPTPAEESVQLYNDVVVETQLDEQDKLASFIWRTRQLCRAAPSDFAARVVMASVLLRIGQRDEALENLDTAYGLRQIDKLAAWEHLAFLFTSVLDYERAGELIRSTTSNKEIRYQGGMIGNAARFAICSGDITYLRELAEISDADNLDADDESELPGQLLRLLDEGDLAPHLGAHQQIITDLLSGVQSWTGVNTVDEDDGSEMIVVLRYVQHGKADRFALRRSVTDALNAYYQNQGLAPGRHIGILHTSLINMPEPVGATAAA